MCGRYPVNPGLDSLVPEPALQHKFAWLCGHLVDHAVCFATAGLKSLFQKSPLKNQAVHGATIYHINPPIST